MPIYDTIQHLLSVKEGVQFEPQKVETLEGIVLPELDELIEAMHGKFTILKSNTSFMLKRFGNEGQQTDFTVVTYNPRSEYVPAYLITNKLTERERFYQGKLTSNGYVSDDYRTSIPTPPAENLAYLRNALLIAAVLDQVGRDQASGLHPKYSNIVIRSNPLPGQINMPEGYALELASFIENELDFQDGQA